MFEYTSQEILEQHDHRGVQQDIHQLEENIENVVSGHTRHSGWRLSFLLRISPTSLLAELVVNLGCLHLNDEDITYRIKVYFTLQQSL
uniref:Uncharacterized protein n=1 Tax=Romanomermis culicivorax TaxID=13658 RepID=A0A915K8M6_ROMCU